MSLWLIWLIFAVVLGVAEVFTLTAALGMLGGAALVTVGCRRHRTCPCPCSCWCSPSPPRSGSCSSAPSRCGTCSSPSSQRFGVDALVGKAAYVVAEVTGSDGRVRIGGEEWTARAYDETLVIPAGAAVDVMEINGTTALVYPRE